MLQVNYTYNYAARGAKPNPNFYKLYIDPYFRFFTMLTNEPKIEMVATSALIPYARNAKRHDDAQVAKLAGSIREYGFTNPVLIDAEMKKRIFPLSRPYPKRAGSDTSDTPGFHPGEGGSLPTPALQSNSA